MKNEFKLPKIPGYFLEKTYHQKSDKEQLFDGVAGYKQKSNWENENQCDLQEKKRQIMESISQI